MVKILKPIVQVSFSYERNKIPYEQDLESRERIIAVENYFVEGGDCPIQDSINKVKERYDCAKITKVEVLCYAGVIDGRC